MRFDSRNAKTQPKVCMSLSVLCALFNFTPPRETSHAQKENKSTPGTPNVTKGCSRPIHQEPGRQRRGSTIDCITVVSQQGVEWVGQRQRLNFIASFTPSRTRCDPRPLYRERDCKEIFTHKISAEASSDGAWDHFNLLRSRKGKILEIDIMIRIYWLMDLVEPILSLMKPRVRSAMRQRRLCCSPCRAWITLNHPSTDRP